MLELKQRKSQVPFVNIAVPVEDREKLETLPIKGRTMVRQVSE